MIGQRTTSADAHTSHAMLTAEIGRLRRVIQQVLAQTEVMIGCVGCNTTIDTDGVETHAPTCWRERLKQSVS